MTSLGGCEDMKPEKFSTSHNVMHVLTTFVNALGSCGVSNIIILWIRNSNAERGVLKGFLQMTCVKKKPKAHFSLKSFWFHEIQIYSALLVLACTFKNKSIPLLHLLCFSIFLVSCMVAFNWFSIRQVFAQNKEIVWFTRARPVQMQTCLHGQDKCNEGEVRMRNSTVVAADIPTWSTRVKYKIM